MDTAESAAKLPLVGESHRKLLAKMNIKTVEDLLYHFPFRYEDFSNIKKISELVVNETVTVYGKIIKIQNIFTQNRKKLTRALLEDDTGRIGIVWFNQPYLIKTIKKLSNIGISGKIYEDSGKLSFMNPEYELIRDNKDTIHTGSLVPIYPETRGISSKWLRSRISAALKIVSKEEFIPQTILTENNLLDIKKALTDIHFPKSQKEATLARKRFAFEELFLLHIAALLRKKDWKERTLIKKLMLDREIKDKIDKFILDLPFELTASQNDCVREILKDLTQDIPMNRLLEGDVGSGKTIVAIISTLLNYLNGGKTLYVAPTEILATQQYENITNLFKRSSIDAKVGLLTGSKKIWDTTNNVIVSTHAILYEDKILENLTYVIIDEQHKFGVKQRAEIAKKTVNGATPHLLTMTATPIPRSLALAIYGDLDLSIIIEMPKERQKVTTWVVPNAKRNNAYNWVEGKILKERAQVFVVCPIIEESETESLQNVKSAKEEFENISKIFPKFNVSLIHGKIKPKDKDRIINDVRLGKIDILVSTPIIEVGMDIPNANIIIIEAAERFGLASLHQLRGRVGRGSAKSYCLLFTESHSKEAYFRLKNMEKTNSGIKLAQIDLSLRGPGDIYGTMQHGILSLKVANIFDETLIKNTRVRAEEVIEKLDRYPRLKHQAQRLSEDYVDPN